VILSEPVHTLEVLARHAIWEQMVRTWEDNLKWARLSKQVILEAAASCTWSWPRCTNATCNFG
jgi:hypothetical protein